MKTTLILTLALLFTSGCVLPPTNPKPTLSSFNFTPYIGEQQQWRTSLGATPAVIDGFHIYRSDFPIQPYIVVGELRCVIDTTTTPDVGRAVAQAARAHGATGAILGTSELHGLFLVLIYRLIITTPP